MKSLIKKAIIFIAIVLFILVTLIYFSYKSLSDCMCENSVLSEELSPDKSLKAVSFIRGCGATTSDSLNVSVIPRDEQVDTGNVYVAEVISNKQKITINWLSTDHLVIHTIKPLRIFKSEKRINSVNIEIFYQSTFNF
jgi:L-rhamnose isomerase